MSHVEMLLFILFNISGLIILGAAITDSMNRWAVPFSTVIGISLILYFFSLFGVGHIGIVFIQFLNGVAYIGAAVSLVYKLRKFPEKGWLRPFVWFITGYLILFFGIGLWAGRWFYTEWDEFANWDSVVHCLNLFGEKKGNLVHSGYPSGISMLPYYFTAVTEQNEHIMTFAMAFASIAAVVYGIQFFPNRKSVFSVLFPMTSILFLYIYGFKLNTIMADGLVGLVFGIALLDASHRKFSSMTDAVCFGLLLSYFILLKDVCSAFSLLIIAYLLLSVFLRQGDYWKSCGSGMLLWIKQNFLKISVIFLFPFASWISWHIRCNRLGVSSTNNFGQISPSSFSSLIQEAAVSPETSALKGLISYILHAPFFYTGVSISVLILTLLTAGLLFAVGSEDKKAAVRHGLLWLGCCAYLFSLVLVYLFVLGEYYAYSYVGLDRFMMSYLLAWTLVLASDIFGTVLSKEQAADKMLQTIAVLFIAFTLYLTPVEFKFILTPGQDPLWKETIAFKEAYVDSIPQGSVIKPILQNSDHEEAWMLQNLFMAEASFTGEPMTYGKMSDYPFFEQKGREFQIADLTVDGLSEVLAQNDYDFVLIKNSDLEFWKTYGSLFLKYDPGEEAFGSYQLFRQTEAGKYVRVFPDED